MPRHITHFLLLGVFALAIAEQQPVRAQDVFDAEAARNRLVESAIIGGGIKSPRVIKAMRTVPRHLFVARTQWRDAYLDTALPIGHGQTISPPYVVAYMTEQLDPRPEDAVLEIGTGSGYQAAVLGELCKEVYTIEIVEPLGLRAAKTLKQLDYKNVHAKVGDGYKGWPEHAPFDKIIVTCSPEKVPEPLVEQLKDGGRLVVPVGERFQQTLYLYKKVDGELKPEALQTTYFVPMTGQAEELRVNQADPEKPEIVNGSFEETFGSGQLPAGWYYVRNGKVEDDNSAPDGERRLTFTNPVAGRPSKAVQALGIDGKKVREIELSFEVRGRVARPAQVAKTDPPGMFIEFYDKDRKPIGSGGQEVWPNDDGWITNRIRVKVPGGAILGVVLVGMGEASGTISFDSVQVKTTIAK